MADAGTGLRGFLVELRRRKVYRVAVVYAVVAFVIWQAAEIAFPALHLPEWTLTLVVVLTLLGFPIAIVLAWAFDITREGVKRAGPTAGEPAPATGQWMALVATAGLAVVVLLVAAGWFLLGERAARGGPVEHSVAVLPFANLSAEPENEYFSDGIAGDIITQLSKIADITVTSGTSSMRYKGSDAGIRQIAEELGVATILEGGVQRVGDRVHINAQLSDATTERHLWADTYDEELTAGNIFEVQGRIARSIAEALNATLSPEEEERLGRKPTENLAAYHLFLLGRNQWQGGYSLESIRRSIDYFERAIEEDSGYARAHAGLAHAYAALGYWGFPDAPLPRLSLRKAREAVTRALEIDDELPEAHTTLATLHWRDGFEILEAEREIKRAIDLDPDDPLAHQEYGLILSILGRHDESIEEMKKAKLLDPLSPERWSALAWAVMRAGRYDESIELSRQTIERYPNFPDGYIHLGWAHRDKGMYEEAIQELGRGVALSGRSILALASLGHTYGVAGRDEEARAILREVEELAEREIASPYFVAFILVGLGEHERAVDWLEQAYAERWGHLNFVNTNPGWDALRSDPRFKALVRGIGLEE